MNSEVGLRVALVAIGFVLLLDMLFTHRVPERIARWCTLVILLFAFIVFA